MAYAGLHGSGVAVLAGLLACWPGVGLAQNPASGEPLLVELRSNESELYPRFENVAIRSMERLPSGVGLQLVFVSDAKEFSHFLYSTNSAPFRAMEGEVMQLVFEDRHTPDVQFSKTVIRAVNRSGAVSADRHIDVNYYPRELYARAGQTAPGYVVVKNTDIPIVSSRVNDWVISTPTTEDVEFARKAFGSKITGINGALERARALGRAVMDDLQPHRGVPSDKMRTVPFEQYRRAMAGTDSVWCGNLADVFVHACICFGIPARIISMMRTWSKGEAFDLLMAEGHATTEIFDGESNRWVWIDLTFKMTGMELPGYGLIHMAELHRALNDPDRIRNLTAIVYDPLTRTEQRVPATVHQDALLNYFKKDQSFTYRRRASR